MDDRVRKNYTLYLNLYGNEIEILKGTLKEIDDFTTYFQDSNAMFKVLSSNMCVDSSNYFFTIKSSKGKIYDVIYYPYRPILFDNNINCIMVKLKEIDKDTLIKFLINHTTVQECINVCNAGTIPVVRFYKSLLHGNNYYAEFDSYVKSDYISLRNMVINILSKNELSNMYNKLESRRKKEILSFSKINEKKIFDIYSSIEDDKGEEENLYEEPIIESIEDRAFNILNNSMLSEEEKIEELGILFCDDVEKLNSYVYKLSSSN